MIIFKCENCGKEIENPMCEGLEPCAIVKVGNVDHAKPHFFNRVEKKEETYSSYHRKSQTKTPN